MIQLLPKYILFWPKWLRIFQKIQFLGAKMMKFHIRFKKESCLDRKIVRPSDGKAYLTIQPSNGWPYTFCDPNLDHSSMFSNLHLLQAYLEIIMQDQKNLMHQKIYFFVFKGCGWGSLQEIHMVQRERQQTMLEI